MSRTPTKAETKDGALPEADRLDEFAHPREVSEYFGHGAAEQALLDAFNANHLHHAWLFTGPEGIGKATLAYRFARFLLAHGSQGNEETGGMAIPTEHPVFGQVAALSHPNLLVLRRAWQPDRKRLATAITVSEARRLRRFFGHTAGGDSAWRVVIIDRADELNGAAANALLKNLEEPPARCVFVLVCSAPGRLPITIRSRCRTLGFSPLGESELEAAVSNAFENAQMKLPDTGRMQAALPLAQGSVGRALQLLGAGGEDMHSRLVGLLGTLPDLDYQAVHGLADKLAAPGAEASYELFFSITQEVFARMVTHAATGNGAIAGEEALAARLKSPRALAQWASLWETVRRAKAQADALNLDRKNLVLGTFFRLEQTARQALQ